MNKRKKYFVSLLGAGLMGLAAAAYWHIHTHTSATPQARGGVAVNQTSSKAQTINISAILNEIPSKTYYENRVVVATFHDIAPVAYSPYVVTPTQFAADLDVIQSRFHIITNQQFVRFMTGRGTVPPNAVLLTFDDGYRNMYTYALPQLMHRHLQGTFFEIVGTADQNNPTYLSWDDINTMVRDGMAIESHTYNSHFNVTAPDGMTVPALDAPMKVNGKFETAKQYYLRVYNDLLKSRVELGNMTGEQVTEFAWPYGWGNPEAKSIAQRVGYAYLYTTSNGNVSKWTSRFSIPRIDIGKPSITPLQAVQLILEYARDNGNQNGPLVAMKPSVHKNGQTQDPAHNDVTNHA